jgi:Carboxypeptidase regulatory-like domain
MMNLRMSGRFYDATSSRVTPHRDWSSKLHTCAAASLLIICACIYLPQAKAKDNCRDIRGIVVDSEGKPIDHAPVIAATQAGNVTFSVFTKADGSYVLPGLSIGIYSLSLQMPGFQSTTVYGIRLDVDNRFFVKIEMLPGKMTSAVLVPVDTSVSSTCTHNKSRIAQTTPRDASPTRISRF